MRMTCGPSCQDPNPSSEFMQDLVDPFCIIACQSPSSKDCFPPSPHLAGADNISPLDVVYSAELTSKAASPSGESFSDCSLSEFGTSSSQESYPACSMDQGFCPQDELFSAGSYPSPGSVASNPTRWSMQGYYIPPTRQHNDPLLTFEPLATNNQVRSGHHSDVYEASSLAVCTPGVPVSALEGFAYSIGPELHSPSIPAFHSPWHGPEMAPRARSVNPSSMHRNISHTPQWTHSPTYEQDDGLDQRRVHAQETQDSQTSRVTRGSNPVDQSVDDQASKNETVPATHQALQIVHSQTPKSELAALTPASGPIPLYRVEPWQPGGQSHASITGDSEQLHTELYQNTELDSVALNYPSIAPSNAEMENGIVAKEDVAFLADEILVEANGLEPARKSGPLYNVKPENDGQYYCPYAKAESCNHPPTKLKCNYDKYIDAHLKPHRCKNPECRDLRFSSTACRLRHEREAHGSHGHGVRPYLCKYPECDRSKPGNGFPRSWNRNDHMKRVHDHAFLGENEDTTSTSTTKSKIVATPPNGSKNSGTKRKQPPDLAPREEEEEESVKKAKRSSEDTKDDGPVTSLTLQQRVDAVQGQWRQLWTEAYRQLHTLKGPLQIPAAQELQTTVEALLASSYQLSELVGSRPWLVRSE